MWTWLGFNIYYSLAMFRPLRAIQRVPIRAYSKLNRPGPIPLPKKEQQEFEQLQKKFTEETKTRGVHPAAAKFERYEEFEGNVNPKTGEVNGPKQDPLRHGDYSFDGRVTDF